MAVFAIALVTYTLTLEPTVSYWDCGEYIATSVKLEVGHPPGAPLFQMLRSLLCHVYFEVTEIAKMVNLCPAWQCIYHLIYVLDHYQSCKKIALNQGSFPTAKQSLCWEADW